MTDPLNRLHAALAGRYALESELGSGAMAIVYLARDLKHNRPVALKVVRPELTVLLGPERFLREIAITGRLQHPHILPLLDSGEADGLLYYVMPYVAGETLRQRLERERRLPVEEAVRLAREVADALDYAHRQGVVHRDVKPENLLVSEGHAVVADFGIARAVDAAGEEKLTATGRVVGTPVYMSPEQATGDAVDGRSDQYSLACVLYELLAGAPPFVGPSAEAIVQRHLRVVPRPVTEARPSVPGAVGAALQRALAKSAVDRFETAGRFGDSLGAAMQAPAQESAAAASGPTPSAAEGKPAPARPPRALVGALVLVLVAAGGFAAWKTGVLSGLMGGRTSQPIKKDWILVAEFEGPADDTSLAGAVRDLVNAALEQSQVVALVPPEQVRIALEKAGKPVSTRVDAPVARELAYRSAVRAVLEGRVGRLGKGFSIVLRLVDADSAKVMVSVSDAARSEDDLIPAVSRIARKLRVELREHRSALQATRDLDQAMTPSFEAYRRYIRARDLQNSFDHRGAMAVARSALALDPDFSAAWGVVAFAFGGLDEPDSALAVCRRLLAHPERITEVYRLQYEGIVATLNGDNPTALAIRERLVQLYPDRPGARNNLGLSLARAGRWTEALESYRAAERVSPFGPHQGLLNNEITALLFLGRTDEARKILPRLKGDLRENWSIEIALTESNWQTAERLATTPWGSPTANADRRRGAGVHLASVQAARGQVEASERTLREIQASHETAQQALYTNGVRRLRLFLALVTRGVAAVPEGPGRWDSTTAGLLTRGLWAAAAGDTTSARRFLAAARSRPAANLARQGSSPELLEGWIAASCRRWPEVVQYLGPAALQSQATRAIELESRPMACWMVAEAYDALGRPDSAAAYFEKAITPFGVYPMDGDGRAMAFSYAHRRLVLLYARMRRLKEARRHWGIFSATFTRPDPEQLPLIAEARAALGSAVAKSAGR